MAERPPAFGDAVPRLDGVAKVTGTAGFPSDLTMPGVAHALLLTSPISRGRIRAIDDRAARALPGFLLLLTHENSANEMHTAPTFVGKSTTTVESADIMHDGQIIGLVVAETLEQVRACAAAVRFDFDPTPPSAGFDATGATVRPVAEVVAHHEDPTCGDASAALATAAAKVEARYSTPTQHQNALELFNTTCWWSNGRLTVHEPSQFVYNRGYLAQCFGLDVDQVRVVSRFCGGGFGGRASGTPRTVLVAIAARRLNRPVKLMATRDQGFTINTHRAETRHQVRLGANRDGKLQALLHEGWEVSSRPSPYTVSGTDTSARMYACPNIWTRVNVVQADRDTPGFMRCPAELPYMFALESALDEMAVSLQLDPVELRRRNDTMADPIDGRPFSSRSLLACLDEGVRRFGWKHRDPTPRAMREGDWLVGWGMATACYPANGGASAVRISLDARGRARVQVAFHEIGNGAYTVIGQTAAVLLGIPLADVSVELGDTLLPVGNIAAGSNGTATTCNAVAAACEQLRARLASAGVDGPRLRDAAPADIRLDHGWLVAGERRESLQDVIARLGGMIETTAGYVVAGAPDGALERLRRGIPTIGGGIHADRHIACSFGAQFVEVRVHARTGEVRVPRATGVFAAGRIINRRTAHSQLMGGMIWGIGAALLEETLIDRGSARYLNDNLGDYTICTNADVGEIDIEMLDEVDYQVNPLGIKGVGELGCCGINAAVANAVFHATGRRLRDLPIRAAMLI